VRAGDTFYNRNPGSPERLWIVASDPTPEGDVVIFMVAPRRPSSDVTCPIPLGHHPCVRVDSIVDYKMGRRLTAEMQATMLRCNFLDTRERLDPGLLRRIQVGALASEDTPEHLQALVAATLGPRPS